MRFSIFRSVIFFQVSSGHKRSESQLLSPNNCGVIRAARPFCRRMTERCKVKNPEYNIFRDQPIPGASPLRINTLLYGDLCHLGYATNNSQALNSPITTIAGEKESSKRIQFSADRRNFMNATVPRISVVNAPHLDKAKRKWNLNPPSQSGGRTRG